jgi:hypothetical protein
MFTEQLTQALAIPAAVLPPVNRANNATAYTVGPVDMSKYKRVMALVKCGVLTGSANVQAYFQTCSVSNGTFANISGGNTVTLSTNNQTATLELRSDQITAGDRYLQLAVLVNANSAFCDALILGGEAAYKPANAGDVGSNLTRVVL